MKSYLITDPKYYKETKEIFKKNLLNVLSKHKPDFICFRDKTSNDYENLAKTFITVCKASEITNILLNQKYLLAHKLNASGVHLTSKQFKKIKEAKKLGLYVIISCHNEEDIKQAILHKADAISFSPIFDTPNKGEAKGIEELMRICNTYEIKVFALGGIIEAKHLKEINKSKAYGFASIRYFL